MREICSTICMRGERSRRLEVPPQQLQILWGKSGLLGNLGKKPRADLFIVMEGQRLVGPARSLEPSMRALLPGDRKAANSCFALTDLHLLMPRRRLL